MSVKIFGILAGIEYLCSPKQAEVPIGRVVYRGNNNANANGGVSYANANNDASNSNTNVGSRLDNQRILNRRTAMGTCSPMRCRGNGASPKAAIAGKVKNGVTGRVW